MKIKRIDFSRRFEKDLSKAPKKIKIAFKARLEIFLKDKFNQTLNNHSLTGNYKDYRSINVTGDFRAIFREFDNGEVIYFETLGTHAQLYK